MSVTSWKLFQCLVILLLNVASYTNGISWNIKTLSVSPTTVSSTASLSFYFSSTKVVQSGDCIIVSITSPYYSTDETYSAFKTSPTCSFTSSHAATCSMLTSLSFKMLFTSTSTSGSVIGTASNFINPYSQTNLNNILVNYYSGCVTTTTATVTGTAVLQNFGTGTILSSSVTVSSSPLTVGYTEATLAVSFKPSTLMLINGEIDILVPVWYTIGGSPATDTMLDSTSVVTSSVMTIKSYSMDTTQRVMSIYYTLNSGIDATSSSTISLSITNFRNPISTALKSGFQISTKDPSGNLIDQSSSTLPMSAAMKTLATMDSPAFTFQTSATSTPQSTFSVAQPTILTLNIQMPVPASDNCWMKVTFPSDITLDTSLNTFYGTGFLMDPTQSSTIQSGYISRSTANNYVIINGCQISSYIGSSPGGSIGFQYINMPAQVKSTGVFTVVIYADSLLTVGICQATTFFIDASQLTPGTISLNSYTPITTWLVQTSTSYQIIFTPQHKLYYNSQIKITVPTLVTLGSSCSITSSSGLGSSPTCTISGTSYVINTPFNNGGVLGQADYSGGSSISISIASGTNPVSARDAGAWTVSTYNCITSSGSCSFYQVDSGTASSSFLSVSGQLVANPGITTNSITTYASSSTYTFLFDVAHNVPSGGIIYITIPSQVSISSTTLAASSATYVNTGTHMSASATSNTIKLTMPSSHLTTSNPLKVSFGGILNPRTYQTTDTFTVQTQDSSGYVIDQGSGFTITMTSMGSLSSFSASMNNKTNGAQTTYTLTFATSIPMLSSDILYLTFPSEITLTSNSIISCGTSSNLNSVSCSASGQNLQVKLSSVGSSTGSFAFTVANIYNPYSTRPSSSFSSIYVKDSSGYNVAQYTGSATVTTTTAANILYYSLTQASLISLASTGYVISFTPTNPIASTGSIILIWPSSVTIPSTTGCFVTTTSKFASSCSINLSTNTITITGIFSAAATYYSNNVIIELTTVTNPKDNTATNGFQVYTYADAAQKYSVDSLKDYILVPQLQCNYPCNTCTSNKNYCLSCWTSGTYPYLQYVSSTAQTCYSKCSNGYTTNGNTNKQCTTCDVSCATCVDKGSTGDKYKCSSCSSSYQYQYAPAQQCLTSCGLGYYEKSSYSCDVCVNPCQGCSKTATNCTSCFAGSSLPNLYNNNCVTTCPTGYASVGFQCQKCSSPCSTCVNQTNLCVTCDPTSSSKYNFAYSCYNTCPTGTNPNPVTLKCEGCLAGCSSCDANNQTKCLSCSFPLVNFEGTCMTSCPAGYKSNFAKTSCIQSVDVSDLTLVYFPHLIAAFITSGICIGGYFKDRRSLIISNILVFWGPIYFVAIIVQLILSFAYANYLYMGLAAGSLACYIVINIVFSACFMKKVKNRDENFQYWWQYHAHTYHSITTLSMILSFMINRLLYSFFYGHDSFKASFTNPLFVQKLLTICSILNFIFTSLPILAYDVIGLIYLQWGTQLYITMIETAILSIFIFILSIIELCKLRRLLLDAPSYKQVNSDSQMMTPGDDSMEKKNRKKALKAIMAQVKGNRDLFLNNKLDELLQDFGGRKCKSMIAFDNEKEEDDRKIKSFPLSPKSRKEYDGPFSFSINDRYNKGQTDNVYAESKLPDPDANAGKTYSDANTQLEARDLTDAFMRKDLDLITLENDDGMNSSRRGKKTRRRGRKNKYYTQIDEEDDEEADALEDDLEDEDELDTIKEEDEEVAKKNKLNKKLLQQQQQEEEEERQRALQEAEMLRKQQEEEKKRKEMEELQILQEQQKQEEIRKQQAEQERLLKEEKERRVKEQQLLQEKLEQERQEKERLEKLAKEQALLQQQEEIRQQQERERLKQLELEKELEEERLKKEEEEKNNKINEELEASRLEEEIVSNKETDAMPEQQTENIESKNLQDGSQKLGGIPHVDRPSTVIGADSDTQSNQNNANNNDVIMMEESLKEFQSPSKAKNGEIEVPPDASKRNFNENDILGDFDRDEKGNVIVLEDQDGNFVDKQGRPVNERGYLLDKDGRGDIVNNADSRQKMFDKNDMDERGEIPAPFCVEKYNFNPHNIRGDFDYDKQGKPLIIKNKRGELVDKKGRKVNSKGYLCDRSGNIIDKYGRKKFDKKQLISDGDLPQLFNYNGRRFDINDIIGQFDKDPNNNIILKTNSQGEHVDNLGRRVNEQGYLLDKDGNIINKTGKKIFDKKHLKNGEIPKIFPFTKFNIKNVLGTFEMDPLGNPILDKNQNGELLDKDGRKVNERGYLIDGAGNVIDKNGKLMFDKDILDKEGEIPKVFRTGLLKSDTASSLSRLMSEIEKNQPSEYDDEMMVQKEVRRLGAQTQQQVSNRGGPNKTGALTTQRRESGGNSSVDSMMDDTPSNYNIANQRFEPARKTNRVRQDIQSNNDGETGEMAKKRRKKKRKMVAEVFVEPSGKDLLMAKAYGGQAKATVKRKVMVPQQNARIIATPASFKVRDQAKEKLERLTNSISGYQNDPNGSSRNRATIGVDHFRPPVSLTQSNFLDQQSNDASMMAVPEHHLREQKLKQAKMNELKHRNRQKPKAKRQGGGGADPDFEKMFGKDIDEFLEDSDWDIESFEKMSQYSRGSSRSAFGQGRLRGLESIYLQRLETSMKKGQKQQKSAKPKAKFRVMHDRFIDDPELMLDGSNDKNSGLSPPSGKKIATRAYMESANSTYLDKDKSDANIFHGNKKFYDNGGQSTINFEKSYVP